MFRVRRSNISAGGWVRWKAVVSSTSGVVRVACVSYLPWTTEHLSLLSHSLMRIYSGCHWNKWTYGHPHLWILDHCNSKYNTDIEWQNKTSICQLCFRSSCCDYGTRPTTLCVNQQSVVKYIPWKDPQCLHAIDAIDLLNTPTDGGATLLLHINDILSYVISVVQVVVRPAKLAAVHSPIIINCNHSHT